MITFMCIFIAYTNIYFIEPGQTVKVEAAHDPIGLKIAIVYDAGIMILLEQIVMFNKVF